MYRRGSQEKAKEIFHLLKNTFPKCHWHMCRVSSNFQQQF